MSNIADKVEAFTDIISLPSGINLVSKILDNTVGSHPYLLDKAENYLRSESGKAMLAMGFGGVVSYGILHYLNNFMVNRLHMPNFGEASLLVGEALGILAFTAAYLYQNVHELRSDFIKKRNDTVAYIAALFGIECITTPFSTYFMDRALMAGNDPSSSTFYVKFGFFLVKMGIVAGFAYFGVNKHKLGEYIIGGFERMYNKTKGVIL